jgi:hypothetical protein
MWKDINILEEHKPYCYVGLSSAPVMDFLFDPILGQDKETCEMLVVSMLRLQERCFSFFDFKPSSKTILVWSDTFSLSDPEVISKDITILSLGTENGESYF